MAAPFDYSVDIPNPGDAFLKGFKTAEEIRGIQVKRAEEKRALDAQIAMQNDLGNLYKNPTIQGINQVMAKYPAIADKFKPLLESMNEQQKGSRIQQANNVFMPLLQGRRDIALEQLKLNEESAKNSGDTASANSMKLMRELVENEDTGKAGDNAVLASVGSFLSAAMGEKEFAKTYEALDKARREGAEAPYKLSKAMADSLISQNKARMGEDKQTLNTESGIYERQGDEWVSTGLKPFRQPPVQVSLNEGQKGFENETTLRKEFNTEAKPFNEVASAYSRLESASKDDTGASDIAMIYSYMKMLDPGSVVREGEFATAENAGGVGEKVRNLYNKVMQGTRLTPAVRADYLNVAQRLNTQSKVKFNKLKSRYRGISVRAGLNPENTVTLEEPETDITKPTGFVSADEILAALGKR